MKGVLWSWTGLSKFHKPGRMGHGFVLRDFINVTGQDRHPGGIRAGIITRYRKRDGFLPHTMLSLEDICRYDSVLVGLGRKGKRTLIRGAIPATSDMHGGTHTVSLRSTKEFRYSLCSILVLLNSSYANAWLDVQRMNACGTTRLIANMPFYPCADLPDIQKVDMICNRLCRYVLSKCSPLRFTLYMKLLDSFVDGMSLCQPVNQSKYVADTLLQLSTEVDDVFYEGVYSLIAHIKERN